MTNQCDLYQTCIYKRKQTEKYKKCHKNKNMREQEEALNLRKKQKRWWENQHESDSSYLMP